MNKAIFLDRDGVLNKFIPKGDVEDSSTWNYIMSWKDFKFLPGVFEAFKLIKDSDYIPIVVSNQSCVGKGYVDYKTIMNLFSRMKFTIMRESGSDDVAGTYFCPHDTDQRCACRKPSPGMLYQAAIEHDIVLEDSWMIGDSWSDIEAGYNAGVRHYVKIGPDSESKLAKGIWKAESKPSLLEAVKHILKS